MKQTIRTIHDPRHYEFTRDSKLPIGYFDSPLIRISDIIIVLLCAAAVVAMAMGWLE